MHSAGKPQTMSGELAIQTDMYSDGGPFCPAAAMKVCVFYKSHYQHGRLTAPCMHRAQGSCQVHGSTGLACAVHIPSLSSACSQLHEIRKCSGFIKTFHM